MPIGQFDNNKDKKYYSPTVYSNYKFSNTEGFDPSQLNHTFWNGLLKVSISPLKPSETGEIRFDHEHAGEIYLSAQKAGLLAREIDIFLKDPTAFSNVGVSTNKGIISISNGKEFNVDSPVLVIRKISQNASIEFTYAYQFKNNIYSVRNFTENMDFDKVMYENFELLSFRNLLDDYSRSMSGSMAYSVLEYGKFDYNRINGSIKAIAEAVGVQPKDRPKQFSKSYFDTNDGSKSYSSETIKASNIDNTYEMDDLL